MEMNFSRSVESAADRKGSDTCAAAGFNPYGMVWLFQKFQKSGKGGSLEMLSDHPRDDHRIADLLTHFKQNPETFGKFRTDVAKATPLKLPTTDTTTRPQSRYPARPAILARPAIRGRAVRHSSRRRAPIRLQVRIRRRTAATERPATASAPVAAGGQPPVS